MTAYRHYVSGFFRQRADADASLALLVKQGLPQERLHLFSTGRIGPADRRAPPSDGDLKHASRTGTIGSGIGALSEVGLVMAEVSLFVAQSLIAPLIKVGWGSTLSELMGTKGDATQHRQDEEGWFSALIRDAMSNGHVVVVADTWSPQETHLAQAVLRLAVSKLDPHTPNP